MFTSEFVHDVQAITLKRDKVNTDTHSITLVIKTESGEKTMHLFSAEPVEIEGGEDARLKAKWQAEALDQTVNRWKRRATVGEILGEMEFRANNLRRQAKEAQ